MSIVLSRQHGDRLQRPQETNTESDFSGEKDHQGWSRGGRKNSREAARATARRCQGPGVGKVGRATHELQMGPVMDIYLAVCLMHVENYVL